MVKNDYEVVAVALQGDVGGRDARTQFQRVDLGFRLRRDVLVED